MSHKLQLFWYCKFISHNLYCQVCISEFGLLAIMSFPTFLAFSLQITSLCVKTLYLIFQTFVEIANLYRNLYCQVCISQFWLYLAFVSLYPTNSAFLRRRSILNFFSQNCKYTSHNSDFFEIANLYLVICVDEFVFRNSDLSQFWLFSCIWEFISNKFSLFSHILELFS